MWALLNNCEGDVGLYGTGILFEEPNPTAMRVHGLP